MDESENNTVNDSEKSSNTNTASNKNLGLLLAGILVLAVVAGAYHFMKGKENLPPTLPPAPPEIDSLAAPDMLDEGAATSTDEAAPETAEVI